MVARLKFVGWRWGRLQFGEHHGFEQNRPASAFATLVRQLLSRPAYRRYLELAKSRKKSSMPEERIAGNDAVPATSANISFLPVRFGPRLLYILWRDIAPRQCDKSKNPPTPAFASPKQ
jgi:hypothetical protein